MSDAAQGGATGPRTPEGKAVASRNALRHGLLSRMPVLPDEDEQVFLLFRERLLDALCPEGDLEVLLADRVVLVAWRLQRLLRVEVGVFASYYFEEMEGRARANVQQYEVDLFPTLQERDLIIKDPRGRDAALQALAQVQEASRRREDARLARAFIRDAREIEALAKLARYETALERSLYRTLGELRRLQATTGGGQAAMTPVGEDDAEAEASSSCGSRSTETA